MIAGSKVVLREKRIADAWNDYAWETDVELAHLDAVPPATIAFSRYLSDYTDQLRFPLPTSYRLAIETQDGKHIGNCSCYNISEAKAKAELGIMIGDRDYWNKGYGTGAVATLVDYIFRQTSLDRLYLKTLQSNTRAQKCFQKCGFTSYDHLTKDGFSFILMEIYRDQWQEQQTET